MIPEKLPTVAIFDALNDKKENLPQLSPSRAEDSVVAITKKCSLEAIADVISFILVER